MITIYKIVNKILVWEVYKCVVKEKNLQGHRNILIRFARKCISEHSADFWLMTEDFANADNRIYYDKNGNIHLSQSYHNLATHKELIQAFSLILRKIGYHFVHHDLRTERAVQHQCGTVRFGNNPREDTLDIHCKAYDVDNLYVVDVSVFSSSSALNSALTNVP